MSTRGFIEPSYEGKLSLMMIVPLDIFYEVLFAPISTLNRSSALRFLFFVLSVSRLPLIGKFAGAGRVAFTSEGFARTLEIFETFALAAHDERCEPVLESREEEYRFTRRPADDQ